MTQNVVIDPAANEPPNCGEQQTLTAYPQRDAFLFPFCFDPDGDLLTYTVTRAPSHGTTRMQSGTIVYTAAAGYTGGDDLQITVTDGHGASVPVEQTSTCARRRRRVAPPCRRSRPAPAACVP